MADTTPNAPVRVTADERPHPALQKLARALIALARLRQGEEHATLAHQPATEAPEAECPASGTTEVSHD
jgi:hypothetical protein